ncbi:MAG: fhaB1 [Rickettsiaceae bacterium]|jgi:filamentous hemagglutinin|nr:fhaB1 [Rickettsiaceae bacterium]
MPVQNIELSVIGDDGLIYWGNKDFYLCNNKDISVHIHNPEHITELFINLGGNNCPWYGAKSVKLISDNPANLTIISNKPFDFVSVNVLNFPVVTLSTMEAIKVANKWYFGTNAFSNINISTVKANILNISGNDITVRNLEVSKGLFTEASHNITIQNLLTKGYLIAKAYANDSYIGLSQTEVLANDYSRFVMHALGSSAQIHLNTSAIKVPKGELSIIAGGSVGCDVTPIPPLLTQIGKFELCSGTTLQISKNKVDDLKTELIIYGEWGQRYNENINKSFTKLIADKITILKNRHMRFEIPISAREVFVEGGEVSIRNSLSCANFKLIDKSHYKDIHTVFNFVDSSGKKFNPKAEIFIDNCDLEAQSVDFNSFYGKLKINNLNVKLKLLRGNYSGLRFSTAHNLYPDYSFIVKNLYVHYNLVEQNDKNFYFQSNIRGNIENGKPAPFENILLEYENNGISRNEIHFGSQDNTPIICKKDLSIQALNNKVGGAFQVYLATNLEAESFHLDNGTNQNIASTSETFQIVSGSRWAEKIEVKLKNFLINDTAVIINKESNIIVQENITFENCRVRISSPTNIDAQGDTRINGRLNVDGVSYLKTTNFFLNNLETALKAHGSNNINLNINAAENIILNFEKIGDRTGYVIKASFSAGKNLMLKAKNTVIGNEAYTPKGQVGFSAKEFIIIESDEDLRFNSIMYVGKGINIDSKSFWVDELKYDGKELPLKIKTKEGVTILRLFSENDVLIEESKLSRVGNFIGGGQINGGLYFKGFKFRLDNLVTYGPLQVDSEGDVRFHGLDVNPRVGETKTYISVKGKNLCMGPESNSKKIMQINGDVLMNISQRASIGGNIQLKEEGNYILLAGSINSNTSYLLDKGNLVFVAHKNLFQRGDIYLKGIGDAILKSLYGDVQVNGSITTVEGVLKLIAERGKISLHNVTHIETPNPLEIHGHTGVKVSQSTININKPLAINAPQGNVEISQSTINTHKQPLEINSDKGAVDIFKSNLASLATKINGYKGIKVTGSELKGNDIVSLVSEKGNVVITAFKGNKTIERHGHKYFEEVITSNVIGDKIYIDAKSGLIEGGRLTGKELVSIKTAGGLEFIPVNMYNAWVDSSGSIHQKFTKLASRINAGLLDIDAGKAALFLGAFIKATNADIKAEEINILSIDEIANQQLRVSNLFGFKTPFLDSKTQQDLFLKSKFNITEKLTVHATRGDIVVNGIVKAETVEFRADGGSVLIKSDIYNADKNSAQNNIATIGGNNVYIIADKFDFIAGGINITGDLKVVTKNGVHILPVSVHNAYTHCSGKTTTSESAVRQVISEINAGKIEIDAGKAVEIVGALINATSVNIKADEVRLLSAKEIFERQVSFKGTKKWYGGRNSSETYEYRETHILPIINADKVKIEGVSRVISEAGQMNANDKFKLECKNGEVIIKNVVDIHVHETKSSKSSFFKFSGGKMKVFSRVNTHEGYSRQDSAPTIIHAGNEFYGYSGGKFHLLGSKIIGNKVELVAEDDIVLEAAPSYESHFLKVTESGQVIGLNGKDGSYGVFGGTFASQNINKGNATEQNESEIFTNELRLVSNHGSIKQKGTNIHAGEAYVKAVNWLIEPIKNEHRSAQQNLEMFAGLKAGIEVAWEKMFKNANEGKKNISSGREDNAITGASKIWKAWRELHTNLASGGVTAGIRATGSVEYSKSSFLDETVKAQILNIGKLKAEVEDTIRFEGVKYQGTDIDATARKFEALTASERHQARQDSGNFSVEIPLWGNTSPDLTVGGGHHQTSAVTHAPSHIKLTGTFKLRVQDAKVIGVDVEAEIVDIKADTLLVASVQDIIKSSGHSFNLSLDPTKSVGGDSLRGIYAEGSTANTKWTNNFGNIIGRTAVDIVVKDTLKLAGGLIANAEVDARGNLTDKGKANITAGELIIEKIRDYDDGLTLGLGITPSADTIGGLKNPYGDEHRVKVGYKDKERDIFSAIGQGKVIVGGKEIDVYKVKGAKPISERVGNTSGTSFNVDVSFVTKVDTQAERDIRAQANKAPQKAVASVIQSYNEIKEDLSKPTNKDSVITGVSSGEGYIKPGKEEIEEDAIPPEGKQEVEDDNNNIVINADNITPESIATIQGMLNADIQDKPDQNRECSGGLSSYYDSRRATLGFTEDAERVALHDLEETRQLIKYAKENPEAVANIASLLPVPGSGVGANVAVKVGGKLVQGAKVAKNFYDRVSKGVEKFDATSVQPGKVIEGSTKIEGVSIKQNVVKPQAQSVKKPGESITSTTANLPVKVTKIGSVQKPIQIMAGKGEVIAAKVDNSKPASKVQGIISKFESSGDKPIGIKPLVKLNESVGLKNRVEQTHKDIKLEVKPFEQQVDINNFSSQQKIDYVINEVYTYIPKYQGDQIDITSSVILTENEALDLSIRFLGKGYKEIARGVYRSVDGSKQVRMDDNSLLGNHKPGKHMHLEIVSPNGRDFVINAHIKYKQGK